MKMRQFVKPLFFMLLAVSVSCLALPVVKQAKPPVKMTSTSNTKYFNVQAFQYGFNPSKIVVHQGDRVVIKLTSKDVEHGFAIKEYKINVPVKKGETKKIVFIANQKGTFTIHCSVYCGWGHRKMTGILVVK